MKHIQVKIKKLAHFDESFPLPKYETQDSAGADIRVCLEDRKKIVVAPGQRVLVPTGLSFEIPRGYEIQVRPRSGISLKTTLMIVNSPGTIDADYRGELKIIVGNFGENDVEIEHSMRIAQIVLAPVTQASFELAEHLSSTLRAEGGFGSTGVN